MLNRLTNAEKCMVLFINVFWALKLVSKNLYFALKCVNLRMTVSL